ncbi:MAG: hypothetical protein HQM09_10295 [Candidatus Riflebacteria bacterium]|nr:hypothetical protein [Candidatus Riflebacteria bacterium]
MENGIITDKPVKRFSPRIATVAVAFLAGLFANLAQIGALRLSLGTFGGTDLHLGLFLGAWTAGIALGAAWGGRFSPSPAILLLWAAFVPLLSLLVLVPLLNTFPPAQGLLMPISHSLGIMLIMTVPVTLPLGALIPVLIRNGCGTKLAAPYAVEACGSFFAGLLFSIALGGIVPPTRLLPALPPLLFAALIILFTSGKSRVSGRNLLLTTLLIISWPLLCAASLNDLGNYLDNQFWRIFQPGQNLISTRETPYQRLQIGEYGGQKSLSINGLFADNWPDSIRAEDRVHTFVTAIASLGALLVIGAPPPDTRAEFAKYPNLDVTFVELDSALFEEVSGEPVLSQHVMSAFTKSGYFSTLYPRQRLFVTDPRVFLRTSSERFDGILILSSDPTSLVANRLFTREAFADAANLLRPGGVLSVGITGTENYLGDELESVLLSAHRTLNSVFPEVFALPGDPILFWAARDKGTLATGPQQLGERFSSRHITATSFGPLSFANRLLQFRVSELSGWLQRASDAPVNTDSHPRAFIRQIQLWDIYSDSRLSPLFKRLANMTPLPALILLVVAFMFTTVLLRYFFGEASRVTAIYGISAAVSGGTALTAELALIYLYQNRSGALFQMTAFFFGIYMLGLAAGASGRTSGSLFRLKSLQALTLLIFTFLVGVTGLHETAPVTAGIFWIAFLAGREFPLLDTALRELPMRALSGPASASYLIWSDNIGALFAALLAGPWLFPILGIEGALMLSAGAMALNGLSLFVLVKPAA